MIDPSIRIIRDILAHVLGLFGSCMDFGPIPGSSAQYDLKILTLGPLNT